MYEYYEQVYGTEANEEINTNKLQEINKNLAHVKKELISLLPVKFRKVFKDNSFIAGGCIYSLYNDLEVKDYDFFVTNQEIANKLLVYFSNYNGLDSHKNWEILKGTYKGLELIVTDNAITIGKYQIIIRWVGSIEDVVSQFDFKHNMFYFHNGEIGTLSDFKYLQDNKLLYNEDRARDICGTLIRVNKFVKRGMNIYPEEMAKILLKLHDVGFADNELLTLRNTIDNSYKRFNDIKQDLYEDEYAS